MKIAIMQPYFFPYIGYFQLVHSVEKFVFYDDVNFVNRGWINRNKVLINGKASFLTIPLKDSSQNRLINEIETIGDFSKTKKTLEFAYKKAPYYSEVAALLFECLNLKTSFIGELAAYSVIATSKFLGLNTHFEKSSHFYSSSKGLEKAERLINICSLNNATEYHNAIGGQFLYDKKRFLTSGVKLKFLRTNEIEYGQFNEKFVPSLSIIDVLMFNSVEKVRQFLKQYELV